MMKGLLAASLVLGVELALVRDVRGQVGSTLAGYTFDSDVSEHAKLDLDQQTMEALTDEFKWTEATNIYAGGKNSEKSDSLRTLKGFSVDAPGKLDGEGYYELYKEYYGAGDYANTFITGALNGNGDFGGKPDIFRAECANKGSQYQSVWMYVIHEMEDAINDCNNNDLTDNDKGVKAWDEAWAFYAGSLEGDDGSGEGMMLYELAQKRCQNFGTCGQGSDAPVNTKVLNALKAGRQNLNGGDCDGALKQKNEIVKQMTIPVVQGTLRYVDLTKSDVEAGTDFSKPHAEGLAFARAFLPILDNCDSGDAKTVSENFKIDADPPMKDGVDKVSNAIFDNLACMGLTCDDIGVLEGASLPECSTSGDFKVVKGTDRSAASNLADGVFESSSDSASSGSSGSSGSGGSSTSNSSSGGGLSKGVIAGIVIGALVLLGMLAALLFLKFKKNKKMSPLVPPPEEGDQTFV